MKGDRHNTGKAELSYIPFSALKEISKALSFGAGKYGRFNWMKGLSYTETADAVMRHMGKWLDPAEGDNDEETGHSHLAHAGAGIIMLCYFTATGRYESNDDRAVVANCLPPKPADCAAKDKTPTVTVSKDLTVFNEDGVVVKAVAGPPLEPTWDEYAIYNGECVRVVNVTTEEVVFLRGSEGVRYREPVSVWVKNSHMLQYGDGLACYKYLGNVVELVWVEAKTVTYINPDGSLGKAGLEYWERHAALALPLSKGEPDAVPSD